MGTCLCAAAWNTISGRMLARRPGAYASGSRTSASTWTDAGRQHLGRGVVKVGLVVVEQHRAARARTGDLAGDLGADRAAATGDQHPAPAQQADAPRRDRSSPRAARSGPRCAGRARRAARAARRSRSPDRGQPARAHRAASAAAATRVTSPWPPSAIARITWWALEPPRRTPRSRSIEPTTRTPRSREPVLAGVIVDDGDRDQPERTAPLHLAHDRRPRLARAHETTRSPDCLLARR